jgi:hypothetical protein
MIDGISEKEKQVFNEVIKNIFENLMFMIGKALKLTNTAKIQKIR